MKKYLGVKMIEASEELSRQEYCDYRGWKLPENENGEDRVYLVEYEKDGNSKPNHPDHEGYISMSPKDVFEKAYRSINSLTFGLAVEALRQGKLLARKGWNGKDMFVFKQVPAEINQNIISKMQSIPGAMKKRMLDRSQRLNYRNQMCIVDAMANIDSWVPSSSDIFAEDWYILE